MAIYEELEIEIDGTGAVRVTTKGIKGRECLDYVEVFRRLLGDVSEQQLTAEYYEKPPQVRVEKQAHVRERRT